MPDHVVVQQLVYTIASVERTSMVQYDPAPQMESNLSSQLDTYTFRTYDPDQSWEPGEWDEVVIACGASVVFGGHITSIERVTIQAGSATHIMCDVTVHDYGVLLEKTVANSLYLGLSDGGIVGALIADYLPGFTDNNVGDAGLAIPTKLFNRVSLADCFKQICALSGYEFYIDSDKDVHYFETAANDAPFDLSDSPDNVTTFNFAQGSLSILEDASDIRNRVFVYGGYEEQASPLVQYFSGDGTARYFSTAYGPKLASGSVNGTAQVIGTVGLVDFDDGYDALVDPARRLYYFPAAHIPPAGANNISILYKYDLPVLIQRKDYASYWHFGNTWFDHAVIDTDISTKEEASRRAAAISAEYAFERTIGRCRLYKPGLKAGQRFALTSAAHGITGTEYLIRRVRMTSLSEWYWEYEIEFGDYNPDLVELLLDISRRSRPPIAFDTAEILHDIQSIAGTVTPAGSVIFGTSALPYLWGSFRWGFGKWT